MSRIFDCTIFINVGLFTKLMTEKYNGTLRYSNLLWRKLRVFLTWILPYISIGYLILTSIDQCLST